MAKQKKIEYVELGIFKIKLSFHEVGVQFNPQFIQTIKDDQLKDQHTSINEQHQENAKRKIKKSLAGNIG